MEEQKYPRVSIIILNWNGLEDTIECLESLKEITYPDYDVIVVDNGSEGNDIEILRQRFENYIHIIENGINYGFCEGNNIAIRWLLDNSKPDYFLLLNNDTVVAPEFLTELVKVAESHPSSGIIGPKAYLYDDPNRFWLVWFEVDMNKGRAFHVGSGEYDRGQYENIKDVDYVAGSCLLIKLKVIQNVGLLDTSYFAYWDEADYCLRVRKGGYKIIYAPKAIIWHKVSASAKQVSGIYEYYNTRNGFLFMKKYASKKQLSCFLLRFFFIYFWFHIGVLLLYHRNVRSFKSFLKGTKHGILILLLTGQSRVANFSKMLYRNTLHALHYMNFAKAMEARVISSFLEPRRGEKVCDIACGTGQQSIVMVKMGCRVCGIDMNDRAIETAKLIAEGYDCDFRVGNAEMLPYKSGDFDKVVSVCALEHFDDDDRALHEMYRVLKVSGVLVLTVDSFSCKGIKRSLQEVHRKSAHVKHYYTDSQLAEKLQNAGFEVKGIKYLIRSPVSAFFFNLGIRLNHGLIFRALFPVAYPASVLSERIFGRTRGGYLLAIKAQKTE